MSDVKMINSSMQFVKAKVEPQTSSVAIPKTVRKKRKPRDPIRIRQCHYCERWMEQKTLITHLPIHGEEAAEEAERMKLAIDKKVRCEVDQCGYIASSEQDYKLHMRKTHLLMNEKKSRHMRCPLSFCQQLLATQEDLVNHCCVVHGDMECVVEARTFQNFRDCEEWKESIAKTHCTAWQVNGRSHLHKNLQVRYYRCSRVFSNQYRGRSEPKKPQTMMIVHYCTSFLKEIFLHDGTIMVRYCTRHFNHDVSPDNLPLSNGDKNIIARYLQQGLNAGAVQEVIRQVYNDPKLKLYWVTINEIKRVRTSLESGQRRLEELVSTPSVERIKDEASTSMLMDHDYEVKAISASSLLHPHSDSDDDRDGSTLSEDAVSDRSPDRGIQADSLLGCSSCVKLNERVAELDAIVKRLKDKVIELEDTHLFNGSVKEEGKSFPLRSTMDDASGRND